MTENRRRTRASLPAVELHGDEFCIQILAMAVPPRGATVASPGAALLAYVS
jgi:hypothetical protein